MNGSRRALEDRLHLVDADEVTADLAETITRTFGEASEGGSIERDFLRYAHEAYRRAPGALMADKMLAHATLLEAMLARKRLEVPSLLLEPYRFAQRALAPVRHRFVISGEVAGAAFATTLQNNETIAAALDLVRFPISPMWIELDDRERHEFGAVAGVPIRPGADIPERLGLYVETEAGGRRGFFWMAFVLSGSGPQVPPVAFHFDLDDPGLHMRALASAPDAPGLRFAIRPVYDGPQGRRLTFSDYVVPDVLPYGDHVFLHRNLNRVFLTPPAVHDQIERDQYAFTVRSFAELTDEWCFALALMMLMGAVNGVDERRSRAPKLALDRRDQRIAPRAGTALEARNKNPPNDVTVTMHLSPRIVQAQSHASGDERTRRQAPRLHWVVGHFRRRKDRLFWIPPHLRGDRARGMVPRRTVHVRA